MENTKDREIIITRTISAKRERVFEAWVNPEQIAKWWGPDGFTTTTHKMDAKPKGKWEFVMHGPDGKDYKNRITYERIEKPALIAYSHDSGKENDPEAFQTVVTFEELGEKTKITLKSVFKSARVRNMVVEKYGAIEGGLQTLGRLEEHLAKEEFVISRILDAPRSMVWEAFTDPLKMKDWFGPKGSKVLSSKMDLRPNGIYHYGMQGPDGKEMWGKFTYKEIKPQKMLVFVNSFSDKDMNITRHPMNANWPLEMLSTIIFEGQDGKTKLTIRWIPINASEAEQKTFDESREGMKQGWSGTFEQLEQYLAKNRR